MFAATCRRWLGRFTDRTFLRELLCPGGQGRGLLGFFVLRQGVTMGRTRTDASAACSFLPAPRSPLGAGPTVRALTSSGDGALDYAVPLVARRGLVLMQRRAPRRRGVLLGVCSPVTGERHLVAPNTHREFHTDICDFAIITAADVDAAAAGGRFTFSQLLVLRTGCYTADLHSYSAATRSWSAPTECFNGRSFSLVGPRSSIKRSAVVHQGAAHWLWQYDTRGKLGLPPAPQADDDRSLYKLSVQLGGKGAGRISFAFTRTPVRSGANQLLLCVTGDGELAIVSVCLSYVLVCTCRQAGGGHAETWERTATFRLPYPYPDTTTPLWYPVEKWFHLSRGLMLVLYGSRAVFIVDLHSKTMEKVMDCLLPLLDEMSRTAAVPYEMDLVDFMPKLGGLSISSTGSSG